MTPVTERLEAGGCRVSIALPPAYGASEKRYPLVVSNDGDYLEERLEKLWPKLWRDGGGQFVLAAVTPRNRGDDYTPWSAPGLAENEPPFGGRGADYLAFLTDALLPLLRGRYRLHPDGDYTGLMGYSLGGLHALYALYLTRAFGCVASLSGSLWYDGFVSFMEEHRPLRQEAKIYLSLGQSEKKVRQPRMARGAECTARAAWLLKEQTGTEPVIRWHPGGHFSGIPERFLAALRWFSDGWKTVDGWEADGEDLR